MKLKKKNFKEKIKLLEGEIKNIYIQLKKYLKNKSSQLGPTYKTCDLDLENEITPIDTNKKNYEAQNKI
jgi:hypothetical protein